MIQSSGETDNFKSINISLELLKYGKFNDAIELFGQILKNNYSNDIAESGIKCCKYWISRINKINEVEENYLKGKALFEEWQKFEKFTRSIKNLQVKVISNIMYYIFDTALEVFKKDYRETRILDLNTIYMIALCYKKIGDYKNAINYFKEALSIENDNSNIMTQLADCYALIDEDKKAKILFREAFYIDPASIDIDLLDSNIITYLVSNILEYNLPKNEIKYWIPVFGRILGIFSVKRELNPIEVSKIRREIFYLEKNFKDNILKDNLIKTKLLNNYLWLYDYAKYKSEDKKELTHIEQKIKNISEQIYNIFIQNNRSFNEHNLN